MAVAPHIVLTVVSTVLCILYGTVVEGIQCYKCSNCPQPFNPKDAAVAVVTCDVSCYTETVTTGSSSHGVLTKRCGDIDGYDCGKESIGSIFAGNKTRSYCYCSHSDLCNGERSGAALLMISLTVVLLCLLMQRF